MPDFPFIATLIIFSAGAMMRGQGTYWLARVVIEQALKRSHPVGGWKYRLHNWLTTTAIPRGGKVLNRWGIPAVSVCYLTVGLQTMVIATAGAMRMRWGRFTLAQIPGAIAWGLIYSTIGFAVWAAAWHAAVSSTPGMVVAGVLVIALVGLLVRALILAQRRRNSPVADA